MKMLRPGRPSPALVVATVALIVAMGGTAYASLSLPRNSVGSRQLRAGAVKTAKLKNGAVTQAKIRAGAIGTSRIANGAVTAAKINPAGLTVSNAKAANTANTAQTAGSAQAIAYAHVSFNGALDSAHSRNVSASMLTAATGVYCLHVTVPVVNATATVDLSTGENPGYAGVVLSSEDPDEVVSTNCPSAYNVLVLTQDQGTNQNLSFWVSFN